MINRKLLAALVGLSLASGTLGVASAQTTAAPTVQSAPVTSTAPSAKPTSVKKHTRMHKATHRKHVAHRAIKGTKVASKHSNKVASKPAAKRVHVSRNTKHTTKHA